MPGNACGVVVREGAMRSLIGFLARLGPAPGAMDVISPSTNKIPRFLDAHLTLSFKPTGLKAASRGVCPASVRTATRACRAPLVERPGQSSLPKATHVSLLQEI